MATLDETGLTIESLDEIKTDLEQKWRAEFGESADVSPSSPDGQVIAIFSERFRKIEEALEAVHAGADPDKAVGQAQDSVCALTGTIRDAASTSTVTGTATGTPGTLLSAGREISVEETGSRFATLAPATIVAVPAWAGETAYDIGDRVTNDGNVYQATVAGESAALGGPSGQSEEIVDGTVTWRFLGEGTGAIDVETEATVTGPIIAVSGTLTVIETPVAGWDGFINVLDADLGSDVESHAALRIKRENELGSEGSATLRAIRAAVLRVENVLAAVVFHNPTNNEVDGMPPKSIEAVVQGGDDQEIREALYENVAGGLEMYGTEDGSVIDGNGDAQPVSFSRPTTKDIYATYNLIIDPKAFPPDGAALLEELVVEFGDTFTFGRDVVASALSAVAFKRDPESGALLVPGILDVTSVRIGLAPGPTLSTTIVNGPRDLAVFDTSRIVVNTVIGSP